MNSMTERIKRGDEDNEDNISIRSDDTTIIDNSIISIKSGKNGRISVEAYTNLWNRLKEATLTQNRLEMQNEQLLQQWEESLDYITKIQRELKEEIAKKSIIQEENVILLKRKNETIVIPRSLAVNVLLILFVSFILFLIF